MHRIMKTREEQAVVAEVTQQLINMLENNVLNANGNEPFEGWCENGDIFDDENREACTAMMEKVAPLVDKLTYEYLNLGY